MDLAEFQHTLWDVLTKGDSVKVSSIVLLSLLLFLCLADYIVHSLSHPVVH